MSDNRHTPPVTRLAAAVEAWAALFPQERESVRRYLCDESDHCSAKGLRAAVELLGAAGAHTEESMTKNTGAAP